MNKKEVAEIRKQFTPEKCTITRICSCYVDADKNKKMTIARSFLTLPEEEIFKYLEIFKKTLSGKQGKNLFVLDFPMEQEMEEGAQKMLMDLRSSQLEDEELVDKFYDKVIENCTFNENYLILLIHAAYDYPKKGSDEVELEDSSDEVFTHLLCSICPVTLSKAGLSYNPDKNEVADRIRDWVVDMPLQGFLFPLFRDRTTDIHGTLYYTKAADKLQTPMVETLLGCACPVSPDTQKDTFITLVENTLGETCDMDTVLNIQEKINEIVEVEKETGEEGVLTKRRLKQVLEDSGVKEEALAHFDEEYEQAEVDEGGILVSNIANVTKTEIKMDDLVINVDPAKASLIETKEIDGKRCLVLPVEGEITVNGIRIY